jgi:hypothetical protein
MKAQMIKISMEINLINKNIVDKKHPLLQTHNLKTTEEQTPTKETPIIQARILYK